MSKRRWKIAAGLFRGESSLSETLGTESQFQFRLDGWLVHIPSKYSDTGQASFYKERAP